MSRIGLFITCYQLYRYRLVIACEFENMSRSILGLFEERLEFDRARNNLERNVDNVHKTTPCYELLYVRGFYRIWNT